MSLDRFIRYVPEVKAAESSLVQPSKSELDNFCAGYCPREASYEGAMPVRPVPAHPIIFMGLDAIPKKAENFPSTCGDTSEYRRLCLLRSWRLDLDPTAIPWMMAQIYFLYCKPSGIPVVF